MMKKKLKLNGLDKSQKLTPLDGYIFLEGHRIHLVSLSQTWVLATNQVKDD
jgi:hypothetical protein